MIRIHTEGKKILFTLLIILAIINVAIFFITEREWVENLSLIVSLVVYIIVLQFFRNPKRFTKADEQVVIAPADGRIVAIEEIEEQEYFKDKRLQISIFMSPVNVHVNRYPVSGEVKYAKYHPGAYLVAWHPKSSTLNERTTVVVETKSGIPVMYKQIAGLLARKIVMYARAGAQAVQGQDSGFIKFGSRVDVVLPLDANVLVKVGDKARGGEQVLAELK
ncbi:MAG TPA: phosphatidylserine decarboxylase family protein [Cryomorphaceae bacterium]|nr:phosphatidylserine decarboxylase family protein [Owenweeksia sp.]MBG00523.1 phosphatidylserine decarboxylase family protein [Owenweeksia sp.]HAD98730.1 phosphatidylserine decarboxylase family protein [Cryomorphaceae bacterium]HBF19986.1 phosphatidylserine decarboxylase family protein [Cryomorphaceae bacterium]HCQ15899.1 phosphatidylserine decarboxylase family protein [Cryomorphaceae bacterium]|tara:strand:+ start:965 stop:1624 length:660 start_codon:yes stop_codon:yes gene_type:complete